MTETLKTKQIALWGRAARTTNDFKMLLGLTRALPVTEVMDGAQIEKIDAASMDIPLRGCPFVQGVGQPFYVLLRLMGA